MEGLVLKYVFHLPVPFCGVEAPRGGAGIEIKTYSIPCILWDEAPRGGAGIEIPPRRSSRLRCPKPLVEGLVLK